MKERESQLKEIVIWKRNRKEKKILGGNVRKRVGGIEGDRDC